MRRDQAVVMVVSRVAPGPQGLQRRGTGALAAGKGAGGSGSSLTTACVSHLGAESQGSL